MYKDHVKLRPALIQLSLWLGYGLLLFYWLNFAYYAEYAWPLALRIVLIHALIFYINTLILLPRLIEKNHYIWYILSVIGMVFIAYYLFSITNDLSIFKDAQEIWRTRKFGPPPPSHHHKPPTRFFISRFIFANLLSTLAVLFISTTYWIIAQARKRKQNALSMRNENLQSELKFLKSQINPHFLFNALNNIYSLSIASAENTSEMIMKLSEMLRYVLYEMNGKKVRLAQEIAYIKNFIEFQRLKIEGKPDLDVLLNPEDNQLILEPMLFIPFIENSFKHSNIEDLQNGWIKISLETKGKNIYFSIGNSLPKSAYEKDPTTGIGMQNVQKRLELLYHGKHQLKIERKENAFWVYLTLET